METTRTYIDEIRLRGRIALCEGTRLLQISRAAWASRGDRRPSELARKVWLVRQKGTA